MSSWLEWRSFLVVLFLRHMVGAATEGSVGCLFTSYVCNDFEWCYDDYAFGRCLPSVGQLGPEELYRYELVSKSQMATLENEMERLYLLGYKWKHIYTQCILQSLLEAIRLDEQFDRSICDRDVDMDLQNALGALDEGQVESAPEDVAVVKFRPDNDVENIDMPLQDDMRQLRQRNNLGADGYEEDDSKPFQMARDSLRYPNMLRDIYEEIHPLETEDEGLKKSSYPSEIPRGSYFKERQDSLGVGEHSESESGSSSSMDAATSPLDENNQENRTDYSETVSEERVVDKSREVIPPDFLQRYPTYSDENAEGEKDITVRRNSVKKDGRASHEDSYHQLLQNIAMMKKMKESKDFNLAVDSEEEPGYDWQIRNNYAGPQWTSKGSAFDNDVPYNDLDYLSWVTEHEQLPLPREQLPLPREQLPLPREQLPLAREQLPFTRQQLENLLYADPIGVQYSYPIDYTYDDSVYDTHPEMESLENMALGSESHFLSDLDPDNEFERLERLDVKKPGPEFDPHVLEVMAKQERLYQPKEPLEERELSDFLQKQLIQRLMDNVQNLTGEESKEGVQADAVDVPENQDEKLNYITTIKPKRGQKEFPSYLVPRKHEPLTGGLNYETFDNPINYDVVDMSYGYIAVNEPFRNWRQGADLIKYLEKLLGLSAGTFSNIRVEEQQVTFKVNPNNQGYNASAVAEKIENLRDQIMTDTGVQITSSGIGDLGQVNRSLYEPDDKRLYILIFALCGVVSAAVLIAIIFFIVRHQRKANTKLKGAQNEESNEASRDYQDLCRARMAGKSQEKNEVTIQKVPGIGKDHDTHNGSPHSSRSSTSSWSEEPVTSNMDISTGHMVLAYMEDHMKNKDRLEQEWKALCAYEAEPSCTEVAHKEENKSKNRTIDVLPYDHSRVVLNDLTNMSQSDYINASTITDHDPRNPAYITAQSPLPQTAPDFWQMIWEQGAVVIVMLTRLQENGQVMCFRYWPEVGSDTYNIYEVHLVSEHIWCEDYMVRSFYLKNLKTGETRTVTQFHFLSWPENGTPSSTKALLEFRRKVNKSYRGRSCPIVVHCSDGAGRTGTYVLIDMVLSRMAKGAKEIDIAATLEHIRDQRPNMVRTKQQFEFVLVAVAEEVHAILKALPK